MGRAIRMLRHAGTSTGSAGSGNVVLHAIGPTSTYNSQFTFNPSLPTHNVGDLLVLVIGAYYNNYTASMSGGWVTGPLAYGAQLGSTLLFYKLAGASEPTPSVSWNGNAQYGSAAVLAYSGVNQTTPVDPAMVTHSATVVGTTGSLSGYNITTGRGLAVFAAAESNSSSWSQSAGWTQRINDNVDSYGSFTLQDQQILGQSVPAVTVTSSTSYYITMAGMYINTS